MPVQLLPLSEMTLEQSRQLDFRGNRQDKLLWYKKEPNAEMPIISPGFIESNKASDVDRYTKSIMRTFMSEGRNKNELKNNLFSTQNRTKTNTRNKGGKSY